MHLHHQSKWHQYDPWQQNLKYTWWFWWQNYLFRDILNILCCREWRPIWDCWWHFPWEYIYSKYECMGVFSPQLYGHFHGLWTIKYIFLKYFSYSHTCITESSQKNSVIFGDFYWKSWTFPSNGFCGLKWWWKHVWTEILLCVIAWIAFLKIHNEILFLHNLTKLQLHWKWCRIKMFC